MITASAHDHANEVIVEARMSLSASIRVEVRINEQEAKKLRGELDKALKEIAARHRRRRREGGR